MTSEGLGEMFEGDSADTCAHVDGGLSGGSRVRRPGSEDPHWRELKFFLVVFNSCIHKADIAGLAVFLSIVSYLSSIAAK